MVKRTLAVFGILAVMLMAAGTSQAFIGGLSGMSGPGGGCGTACAQTGPLYVPADCPPGPTTRTIVKTWEANIVGPAPGPAPAGCGGGGVVPGPFDVGLLGGMAAAIATPFDLIFGGFDGVYGCGPRFGSMNGPCGPGFGPIPGVVAAVPTFLAAPTTIFGQLW